ncbi:hypothetical protein HDV06_001721 [Boothiomyces sp. JEL0866]|nr:hypothetical protein HDV06_001721 [Boothiomyces sp. JEL0866]
MSNKPPVDGQSTEGLRAGVTIDLELLGNYISSKLPAFKTPFTVKQFKLGQSNPTFLLIDSNNKKIVIRKKPPGSLLSKTAHQIEREFAILKALKANTTVPVPQVYLFCENLDILGTPFYAMEFLQGKIYPENTLHDVEPNQRIHYFESMIDAAAKLHSVDYAKIGLKNFGKEGGYYARQVKSLYKVSQAQAAVTDSKGNKVGELYRLPDLMRYLLNNQVEDIVTLVHGDFKVDNVVFNPKTQKVIGMLDWELSTIGHPYADLANMLLCWYVPSSMKGPLEAFLDAPRPLPVPEADTLLKLYCQKRGLQYPIKNWDFCVAFAFFRLAVITQGIAARVARNQASSGFASEVAKLFQPCAKRVYEIGYTDAKL